MTNNSSYNQDIVLKVPSQEDINKKASGMMLTLFKNMVKANGDKPYSIDSDLELPYYELHSIGNLISVSGDFHLLLPSELKPMKVKNLGSLKFVGKDVDVCNSDIESLGDLEVVNQDLGIMNCPNITTLGKLKYIGGELWAGESSLKSFGDLEYVGGDVFLENTPISRMYSEQEIRKMVDIRGNIFL